MWQSRSKNIVQCAVKRYFTTPLDVSAFFADNHAALVEIASLFFSLLVRSDVQIILSQRTEALNFPRLCLWGELAGAAAQLL